MFYLGIDQHARQLTISLRDDQGDVVQARQVSTQPEKIQEFFERLKRDFLRDGESFLAVVEVCGRIGNRGTFVEPCGCSFSLYRSSRCLCWVVSSSISAWDLLVYSISSSIS
jgi:hypothetical protein